MLPATQPAPSKNLTDEELKQQFDIHLTPRIQTETEGKEAKWADIDDDEDDWAPETIEWTDGTKVTLGQADDLLPDDQPQENATEQEPSPSTLDDKADRSATSKPLAAKPSSTLGPNTRILRVGGHAEKQQPKASGDVSKAPNERPTLVVKGPAAPKSPWASLPPVEKASPVPVNQPPQRPQGSRFFHNERPPETAAGPPQLTKEIAADDFNRSWRDTQHSAPRELYNSQSGRYEPVVEGRRGQARNEQIRPSTLLQRPMHEQSGPAEPSAAFQTHRTSAPQDGGQWGRRRGSSNVSGGSGAVFGRRMSTNKPEIPRNVDFPPARFSERSVSPSRAVPGGPRAPSFSNAPPSHASMDSHHAQQGQPPLAPQEADEQAIQVPEEDPVEMQQRIMREKRELARQRRKEQEEREEAAKQERIRLKLQALGPPPDKQHMHTSPELHKQQPAPTAAVLSPPKPPVPEPTGEPKQYGMMKVHHPQTVKKWVGTGDRIPEKPYSPQQHSRQLSSPRQPRAELQHAERPVNGLPAAKEPTEGQTRRPSEPRFEPQPHVEERQSQWKAPMPGPMAGPSHFTSWNGSRFNSQATPTGSLWGPPNADRALGNGTFDRNLTSFPPQDIPPAGSLGLSEQIPAGPTTAPGDRTGMPDRHPAPLHAGPRTIAETSEVLSPLDSPEKRPATLYSSERPQPIAHPGPIAPPTTAYTQTRQPDQPLHHNPQTAAWNNFQGVASRKEAEDTERFRREIAARREEQARTGVAPSLKVSFNETWRKVDPGNEAGQRTIVNVTKTATTAPEEIPLGALQNLDSPVAGLPFPQNYPKPAVTLPPRGSRFFPAVQEQPKPPIRQDAMSTRSLSPPPPEEVSSHPVFAVDSHRPLVNFPSPKPLVRLPPGNTQQSPPPSFSAVAAASPPTLRTQAKPIASSSVWQDRFNGLFGKKPAQATQAPQAKASSLAVTSATKEPLDVQSLAPTASVSLPRDDPRDGGKVTTKEVEDEEAIFEDREPGSLPVVKVPNMAPALAWEAVPARQPHPRIRPRYQKPVQSLSVEPYVPNDLSKDRTGNLLVVIRLPGRIAKSLPWAGQKRGVPGPRQRSNNQKHRKSGKAKDGAGSHQNPQLTKKVTGPNTVPAASKPGPPAGNWASRVAGNHL